LIAPGAWLDSRLLGAPAALRDVLIVQRAGVSVQREWAPAEFAAALRGRAEELLAEAMAEPPTRGAALTLLAADALLTLACEWVAERDPGLLEGFR
jgi:hypothetical protein